MDGTDTSDVAILRELVKAYVEACGDPRQDRRRDHWRRLNGLEAVPPTIHVRAFAWAEVPECVHLCADPFFRRHENFLRQMLFRHTLGDDYILEPWLAVQATRIAPAEGPWGLRVGHTAPAEARGAKKFDPPVKDEADLERMVVPHHAIDEKATERDFQRLSEAVGDLIAIEVDRSPLWTMWNGDISTDLAKLRGIEQMMYDMMDRPAWLHRLVAFMRDGVLKAHAEAEAAGDWRLTNHQNQAMPYAPELADPAAGGGPVGRKQLWCFLASQETTLVGPEMFREFMLDYQTPIMETFGLSAYGCCEDLTRKIDVLRKVPNLRRIAVSPMADVQRCAEQIGPDYVVSYRPSPADMVAYGFDESRVRRILRRDLEWLHASDCRADITLKDVETIEGDPTRLHRWVRAARETVDEIWGGSQV